MSEENRIVPWVRNAALIVGGSVVVGGVAYFTYRHFVSNSEGTDNSDPGSVADKIKQEGNSLFQKGKYAEALEKFNEACRKCKADEVELKAICYQNAGACLEKFGRYRECIQMCDKALNLKQRYIKALVRRGAAHSKLDEDKEALRDYTLVTLIDPNSKVIDKFVPQIEKAHQRILRLELEELADKRLAGLDFPIPQTCVQEWLKYSVIHDPVVYAVNTISNFLKPTTDYERLLLCIKRGLYDKVAMRAAAAASKPDCENRFECMLIAARFYMFHNNIIKVKEWLVKFFEKYDSLVMQEQWLYREQVVSAYCIKVQIAHTLEEAEENVRKAEEIYPDNSDARFGLAINALMQKQLLRASEAMDGVLALEPNHPYARFYRTHFDFVMACEEQHMGHIHNYIVQMENLLQNCPRAPIFTYTVLSNIHTNSGNLALALEILEKGLEAYPDLSEFVMLKIITQAKMSNNPEGVEAMTQKFVELCKVDPNNFEAQATYAKICAGKKDFERAFEGFERASQLARQPQELQLVVSEFILMRANRDAHLLFTEMESSEQAV